LPTDKAIFINDAYYAIYVLAKGMRLFIETGKVHYDWYRAKTLTANDAQLKFNGIASQLQQLADESQKLPLNLKTDMLRFASDIRKITTVKPRKIISD